MLKKTFVEALLHTNKILALEQASISGLLEVQIKEPSGWSVPSYVLA